MLHADSLKPFKTNVPGVADDNLYRDDDNDNMTNGEELQGDGETSQKLRPDDTAGPEVLDQTVPDYQSERDFSNEIGIDNAQIPVSKTTRLGRQIRKSILTSLFHNAENRQDVDTWIIIYANIVELKLCDKIEIKRTFCPRA